MSYALVQVQEAQSLIAYIEGIGGDLSGNFLDVPLDELDWCNTTLLEKLTEQANNCLRAAYNDYYNVDPILTNNNTLESIGDNVAIELSIQLREELVKLCTKLRKAGYNVSNHTYPLVLSRSGDILLEVTS